MSDAPNANQAAFWNDAAGRTWVEAQDPLDRQLEPLGRRGMAALAPAGGERVLDIGCGAGATSLALAEAVGPRGEVLGVDISAPLLDAARRARAGSPTCGSPRPTPRPTLSRPAPSTPPSHVSG